jgi:hypothetical protein
LKIVERAELLTVGILCLFPFIFGAETRSGASPIRHGFLPSSPVETFLKTFAYSTPFVESIYIQILSRQEEKEEKGNFLSITSPVRDFFFPRSLWKTMKPNSSASFYCDVFIFYSKVVVFFGVGWFLSTEDHIRPTV